MANPRRREGIKTRREIKDTPGNDISQVNEMGPGWATAATSPRILRTGGPGRPNLGMTGPNQTRYTPLAFAASTTNKQLALPGNKWRIKKSLRMNIHHYCA